MNDQQAASNSQTIEPVWAAKQSQNTFKKQPETKRKHKIVALMVKVVD